MIYDSSHDYASGRVTLTYDGDEPSIEEINAYCMRHYGFIPSSIIVDEDAHPDILDEESGWIYCYRSQTHFF